MYGVQGRTWVALGDPVGPEDRAVGGLIRAFLERCDDFGGVPVFYEIGKTHLHLLRRLRADVRQARRGSEGRPDGVHARGRPAPRSTARRFAGWRRTAARSASSTRRTVPAILTQLRAVSDDWLAAKASAEKGFSLGFFDEAYLSRFPVGGDRARRRVSWRSRTSGRARTARSCRSI